MKCFHFYSGGEKKDRVKASKSISSKSFDSLSTETRPSASDIIISSTNVSDLSTDSAAAAFSSCISLKSNTNLKVFTVSDLKLITRNFSRSAKLGEGGFGCVYKGVIKSGDDKKVDVAVKQLGRRGLQASLFPH